MRIAFAGNPNSGKTTMFNALTGLSGKVGNWGGVTVGRKEGTLKEEFTHADTDVTAVDLPGAYSMSPFTPEEGITSEYVRKAQPDVIVNIIDATNLSRSLFFTTQLLELGIPVVVALNKSDINAREHTGIDAEKLGAKLNCPVIKTVSIDSDHSDLREVVAAALKNAGGGQKAPYLQAEIDLQNKKEVDAEDRRRFDFVNGIVSEVEVREVHSHKVTWQDRLDLVVTNKFAGIAIFAAVMWAIFTIAQTYLGPTIADWLTGQIDNFQEWVNGKMENSPAVLTTVVCDGIIGGVGAVIGFLPLVMVMYFLLALLEDCGYMARVSAVMDPIFKRVGLSGKSVIPIVISTGCAIPGIMSARTIRNERERRATAMLSSFVPCGAKIPVIALFTGAFFSGSGWVSWVCYFLGLVLIFFGALLVKTVTGYKFRKSFFIMELPHYKVPNVLGAVMSMLERAKAYIIKAATIILVCNLVVTLMQSYNWHFEEVEEGMENTSILASIASPFAVLMIPLGFGAWQLAAAAVTGFIAKENVVGTLASVYALTKFIDPDELAIVGGSNHIAATMGLTSVTALAYLFFNLYTPPCFAAIGAMNSELQSKGWLWCAIGLQFSTGYTVAFFTYQIGTLIFEGHLGQAFLPGLIAIIVMAAVITAISFKIRAGFAKKYALHLQAGTVGAR